MATQVFEEDVQIDITLVEAGQVGLADASKPWYPVPELRSTGQIEARTFRLVTLENDFLRVSIAPTLGGRILSIFDRRTQSHVLPLPERLEPNVGGLRGVTLDYGCQVSSGLGERLGSTGAVDWAAEENAVWIAETCGYGPITFHARVELPDDAARIDVEIRFQNRSLAPVPYSGGLALRGFGDLANAGAETMATYSATTNAGISVLWPGQTLSLQSDQDRIQLSRWHDEGTLLPHQVDTIRLTLIPFSGLGGASVVGSGGVGNITGDEFLFQGVASTAARRVLFSDGNQSFTANLEPQPTLTSRLPLLDLPIQPVFVSVTDGEGTVVASNLKGPECQPDAPTTPERSWLGLGATVSDIALAKADLVQRHMAWMLSGYRAMAVGSFNEAAEAFETALLFNGDDPMLWWAKAVADRLAGDLDPDRASLLNAKYLAPLDPLVRSEAFLAQGTGIGKAKSHEVEILAENPANLVEVAARLIEIGAAGEACRWIDEALRHHDLPMLHVLQAYALKTFTRMQVEAMQHLQAAKGVAQGPFPYREIEWVALDALGLSPM